MPALLFSLLIVLTAPFAGLLQLRLRRLLSEDYQPILTAVFLVALLALVGAALLRVRPRAFWPRAGLILLGVALITIQVVGWSRQEAAVNAVERLHFLSFGLLAFLFHRAFRARDDWSTFPLTLIAVTLVAIADESLQFLVAVRTGDGVDVVLDAYAGLCGLLVATAVSPPETPLRPLARRSARLLAGGTGLLTLLLGILVDRLHLGYEICDGELDVCFRSRYTSQELERIGLARSRTWQRREPRRLGPLDLEDHYQTEGMRHVLYRRAARERRDLDVAWKENELLEKYFAPYLDLGTRWDPGLRSRLESERPGLEDSPYRSPVFHTYGRRLFVRPPAALFWGLVVTLVVPCCVPFRWKPQRGPRSSGAGH